MRFINFKFVKTIRFKLSIVLALILFIVSGAIILLFNISIDNYLSTREAAGVVRESPSMLRGISEDTRAIYSNNLESIQKKSILSLPLLAIIYFILGYILAGKFLKPLKKMNSQIAELRTNTLGSQIETESDDEIGELIGRFNEMSVRLRAAFDEQLRFTQDAAHELRTPLTVVRTNIETALDDGGATKESLAHSMREVLVELNSITALANDLLTLSRPQSKIRHEESVAEIISLALLGVREIAKKDGVLIMQDLSKEDAHIYANKQDIVRALSNIMDNAIKYARDGGTKPIVSVSSMMTKGEVVVMISDNGPGILENDLSHIYERFYRADASRQRQTGGFGLGLSIAQKIINEHGGSVSVKSKPGKTVFSVTFLIHRNE